MATVLFHSFQRSFRTSSYQLRPTSFNSPCFSVPILHLEFMHFQSWSSVLVFSWQEDSLCLASSFPWGSNALAFIVNDSLGRTSLVQRVQVWWCSWPGLGSVHGPSGSQAQLCQQMCAIAPTLVHYNDHLNKTWKQYVFVYCHAPEPS